MEPNFNMNKNKDDEKVYTDPLGFKESTASERQNKFLSLRKNKKMKNTPIIKKLEYDPLKDKYELNQNSYDSSNNTIQNFFNSQEKTGFLYELISSNSFNVENIGNLDINLIKFIIVQCLNYYKSEEENNENLKKFFSTTIVTNLIDIMNIFKKDMNIVYSISSLLKNLTEYSITITKIITSNSLSIQKIFDCLSCTNEEVSSEVLKLLYNLYYRDENRVNLNCNIGAYVVQGLNGFGSKNQEMNIEKNKMLLNSPYLKILVTFLSELINDETNKVYKNGDSDIKNNIIYVLLVLCRDAIDENLKLDAHAGLKKMLEIIKEPSELDVSRFGLCEIVDTFLPHIKLESNDPYIVLYSLQILDKFSYLCDVHELIKLDLINQIEQILIVLVDINENRKNPKLYYKNFTKEIISGMLNSISYIISNTIAEYDDKDIENDWEDYIINQTKIIEYFTLCLKIIDIDEEDLVNIYRFFKDFLDGGIEKERFVKLILSNFIEIGLVENLKNNIFNKKYEVIQEILEISSMMLKNADNLKEGQDNFIKLYLEKKGFDEILTTIEGIDFGNSDNSNLARNIQEKFFKN